MQPYPRRSSSARRGLVGLVIGVLLFSGAPLAAWSAPTPTPTPSATPTGKVEAQDDATPKNETTPKADAGEATPSATAEETPTDDGTPSDDESAGDDPSSDDSSDPADEEPAESAEPSASDAPTPSRAPSGRVVAQVVPPATGNNAVITVKVGGNRTSLNAVGALAGLQLALYASATDTTPVTGFTSTCTSDADGDCSFTVPNTQDGGANRDRRFWVKEVASPAGFRANNALVTGPDGGPFSATPYRFQTGALLRNGTTYATTGVNASFMLGTGNAVPTASGGIWQSSRTNPAFPAGCGLRVALVLDVSGSVSGSLPQLKTAANTFVNSLVGTPSSVGLFTFSATAPAPGANNVNRPVTAVSTAAGAATVNGWINGVTAGGTTNWDRGIYQVAQSAATYDIAVVITDGNPTVYGNAEGPGNYTRFREVENGIFSANAVKAERTRMIAVGVGAGVASGAANLQAISGPTVNSDYYQTTNYAQAGAALRALALGSCQGSVSVVKQVIAAGGTQASPAGGWTMTTSNPSAGVTVTPPVSGQTATGTGAVNFPLEFAGGTTSGQLTITETQQSGYTLVQQGGLNATCSRIDPDTGVTTPVPVTNIGTDGFRTDVNEADPVSCLIFNRAPNPAANVVLNKTWVVNGTPYAEGSQPPGLLASGKINGTVQAWGTARTGFSQGDTVALDETLDATPPQCTLDSSRLTSNNGTPVNLPLPASQTLVAGRNTYGITNTLTCQTRLTLDKSVRFGTASPDEWTLDAVAPSGALPGPNGVAGSAGATGQPVTPAVTYPLAESDGPPEYAQFVAPNANPIAGSTGSWTCQEVGTDGTTVIPGFADGLNGGVTVPFGTWVRCTAVNQTATLRLVKEVVNDNGGTAVPADWQLTATPVGGPAGLPTETRPGAAPADAEYFNIRPDVRYNLSESSLPGYANTNIQCQTISPRAETTFIQVAAGDIATCYFTNNDTPAQLTLIKEVDNDDTGGTADPEDWTLSADGPTPITGPSGDDAVTDAPVSAGSYVLSEDGPDGYTPGAWTCTGGTVTGATVVVPTGGDVTCTITNTADAPRLTLVKSVNDTDNIGDAVATDWDLTATGPVTITGSVGDPTITNAAVQVGQYDLAEDGPDGYDASDWVCTGVTNTTATSVTLALGDSATCTITNTPIQPRLTLVKSVNDTDNIGDAVATDWDLTATGPVTITGSVGDPTITNAAVQVGQYDLAEDGPDGYDASDWVCTGVTNTTATSVTLALGDSATCTITNTPIQPRLTLVKSVNDTDNIGDAVATDWDLTATGPVTITGSVGDPTITNAAVQVGQYDLAEDGPDGYDASDWVCTGVTNTTATSVTLALGDSATCTITNTPIQPRLTLVKVVLDGATGADTPDTDWDLTAAGPVTITGAVREPTVTNAPVQVGEYELSEDGPDGYDASSWVCTGATNTTATSVTLALGDSATCTITNTAVPPRLTLVKDVHNDFGGTAVPANWMLSADGPTPISGDGNSTEVTKRVVQVGDYDLSEDGPDGYDDSDWTCAGGDLAGATVTIGLGDDVTCTIVNTERPAQLTLVKVVSDEVPTSHLPAEWTLTADPQDIDGQDPVSGNGDNTSAGGVNDVEVFSGDYQLSEDGPAGFEGSIWVCTGGVVAGDIVTIPSGGNVTCTITNTAIAPRLTLVKQIDDPNDYGTAQPTDWTLTANGPSPISGVTGTPTVTNAAVQVGSYALSESGPPDYTASAWTCVDDEGAPIIVTGASVNLAEGDDVTCTIVNTPEPPTWSFLKLSDPESGATVDPGDEITYGVFLIRREGVDPRNVVVNDDLSDVLNNATLVDGPTTCADENCTAPYGTASISGTTLTWNVPVLDQPIAYVQYTVRVNPDAYGVTLRNLATSPGSSPCLPEDLEDLSSQRLAASALADGPATLSTAAVSATAEDDELCPDHTTHYTPAWELEKTSDPESGSEVDPGDQVKYTLTVTNSTENAVVDNAVVTDDLSDVLQYASLDSVPTGATLTGDTLTWNVPELQPGESADLSYTVTVDDDAYDVEFGNVATPGDGGECTTCTTDHFTPPEPGEPSTRLPNTGGTSLVPLGLGLGFLLAGALVLNQQRRRRLAKAPVKIDPKR